MVVEVVVGVTVVVESVGVVTVYGVVVGDVFDTVAQEEPNNVCKTVMGTLTVLVNVTIWVEMTAKR